MLNKKDFTLLLGVRLLHYLTVNDIYVRTEKAKLATLSEGSLWT